MAFVSSWIGEERVADVSEHTEKTYTVMQLCW
jgi:hypothetical protein